MSAVRGNRPGTRPSAPHPNGFTLVELLVSLTVAASLAALVAVPAVRGVHGVANDARAQANLRLALPAVEMYYDANGTYVGMTADALRDIEPSLPATLVFQNLTTSGYCIHDDAVPGAQFRKAGPAAPIEPGTCRVPSSIANAADRSLARGF